MFNLKTTLSVAVAAGVIGVLAGSAGAMPVLGANLLQAPSFEVSEGAPNAGGGNVSTAGNPWSGWNPWVEPYTAWYTTTRARTGTQGAFTFGDPGGVYQYVDVTGASGLPFEASSWFLHADNDQLAAGKTIDVRVTFFDGPNGTGNNLGVHISPLAITSATPTNVWTEISVNNLIPAGAASAQIMGFIIGPGAGALYMDDASFVVVPEPASLGLLALGAVLMVRRPGRIS